MANNKSTEFQRELLSKRAYWSKVVSKWEQSQLEPRDFAKRNGIDVNHFYYWRRKVTDNASLAPSNNEEFVELRVEDHPAALPATKKTPKEIIQPSILLEVTLPNKVSLKFSTDPSNISTLVSSLGGIRC